MHEPDRAVRPHDSVFQAVGRVAVEGGVDGGPDTCHVVGMHGREERLVRRREGLGRQPEQTVGLVRPPERVFADVPVPVPELGDALGLGETVRDPPQPLLGADAVGDVREASDMPGRPSVRAQERGGFADHRAETCGTLQPELGSKDAVAAHGLAPPPGNRLDVLGMDRPEPVCGAPLVEFESRQLEPSSVCVFTRPVCSGPEQPDRRHGHHLVQEVLGRRQVCRPLAHALLELPVEALELLLCAPQVGHVVGDGEHRPRIAELHRCGVDDDIAPAAVATAEPGFEAAQRLVADISQEGGRRRRVAQQGVNPVPDQPGAGASQRLRGVGIGVQDCSVVRVEQQDRVVRLLEQRPVALLDAAPRVLRALPLDLGGGACGEDLEHLARRGARSDGLRVHHAEQAGWAARAVVERDRQIAFHAPSMQPGVARAALPRTAQIPGRAPAQGHLAGRASAVVRDGRLEAAAVPERQRLERAG